MKSLKAADNRFTVMFLCSFHSVYLQQESLLSKLTLKKSELDKKLRRAKTLRRVSNIIFAPEAVFISAIVCTIVAADAIVPLAVTALQ